MENTRQDGYWLPEYNVPLTALEIGWLIAAVGSTKSLGNRHSFSLISKSIK